jgi:hypothetical protein
MSTLTTLPSSEDLAATFTLSQQLCKTDFVPEAYRNRPEATLAAILYGRELGIGPMQALQQIHVIKGKPGASPELMRALIQRAGHSIVRNAATDTSVTLHGKRADTGDEETVTWTLDDAKRAGLTSGAWKAYPRAMLLARATSELARSLFADVISGISYTPEELESIDITAAAEPITIEAQPELPPLSQTAQLIEVTSQPATETQRRRLHALRRELELDDTSYRNGLQSIAGVTTSKDLTHQDAEQVIAAMSDALKKRNGTPDYWDAEDSNVVEQLPVTQPDPS